MRQGIPNPVAAKSLNPRAQQLNDERDALNRQIAALRNDIREIQARCNMKTLVLVNALLPQDILLHIFSLVKRDTNLAPSHSKPYEAFCPGSVRISHVRSYWRKIALAYPSLWTSEFPKNVEGIRIFLERSKSAPISLDVMTTARLLSHPSYKAVLFSKFPRVVEFHMTVSEEQLSSVAIAFDAGIHHLKILDIQINRRSLSISLAQLRPSVNTAQLQVLRLKSCALDWGYVQLRNLTELKLTGELKEAEKLSIQQLIAILEHSPQLITLQLEHALSRGEPWVQLANRKLILSRFKALLLSSENFATLKLLVDLVLLDNLETLDLSLRMTTASEIHAIMGMFSVTVSLPVLKSPEWIEVEVTQHGGDKIFQYSEMPGLGESYRRLSFCCSWDASLGDIFDISKLVYNSVMRKGGPKGLQWFRYAADELPPFQWWTDLFVRMDRLRTLSIESGCNLDDVVLALTPDDPDSNDDSDSHEHYPPRPLLLPHLGHLTLLCSAEDINFLAISACINLRFLYESVIDTLELPGFTSDYQHLFEFDTSLCTIRGVKGRRRFEDSNSDSEDDF